MLTKEEITAKVMSAREVYGVLTDAEIALFKTTLRNMKQVRNYAVNRGIAWQNALDNFPSGTCPLCRASNEIKYFKDTDAKPTKFIAMSIFDTYVYETTKCHHCLWTRYTNYICANYANHQNALERYEEWLALLNEEEKQNKQVADAL
jgi:hypothetical protein